jgi:hypothetical protein
LTQCFFHHLFHALVNHLKLGGIDIVVYAVTAFTNFSPDDYMMCSRLVVVLNVQFIHLLKLKSDYYCSMHCHEILSN